MTLQGADFDVCFRLFKPLGRNPFYYPIYALARSEQAASIQGSVESVSCDCKKKKKVGEYFAAVNNRFLPNGGCVVHPHFSLGLPTLLIAAPFTLQQLSVPQMWVSRLRFPKKKIKKTSRYG